MNTTHSILMIAVIALVTLILRALPFLVFNGKRETPRVVTYLGQVLPFAIMGMLVVYCLKGIELTSSPFGLPEIIAGGAVVILHLIKRNTLVSIVGGTLIYMALIQFIF